MAAGAHVAGRETRAFSLGSIRPLLRREAVEESPGAKRAANGLGGAQRGDFC